MTPIICNNNIVDFIKGLQEALAKEDNIKGVCLVDSSESQIVVLVDNEPIDQKMAKVFWAGYQAALQ